MMLTSAATGKRPEPDTEDARYELGRLLEVVHLAHRRVATFEGDYHDWARARPSLDLRGRAAPQGGWEVHWRGEGPFPAAHLRRRRIWVRGPDNTRVDVARADSLVRAGVRQGPDWWFWDSDRGLVTKAGQESGSPIPAFLRPPIIDPAPLLGAYWFEPDGTGSLAGREVVRARALPREAAQQGVSVRHEFEFDAEHGTVLRRAVLEDGEPVREIRAVSVRYDADIEPARFATDPRDVLGAARLDTPASRVEAT